MVIKNKLVRLGIIIAQIIVTIIALPLIVVILLLGTIWTAVRGDSEEWRQGVSYLFKVWRNEIQWLPKFLKTGDLDSLEDIF